ncbi:MAG: hypothetical protein JW861_05355 [Bacteroidales bacterium]|nr:hypothetical protein [Bacteroidales bacterium]
MSSHRSSRHHRRRTYIGQWLHDIREFFGGRSHRHHRPDSRAGVAEKVTGSGGAATRELSEATSLRSSSARHHKKHARKRPSYIKSLTHDWKLLLERRAEKRRKERFKKKQRRKHRRERRREVRTAYLRSFVPSILRKNNGTEAEPHTEGESTRRSDLSLYYYAVNSLCLFIIAYLTVYMVYQMTVLLSASFWGLDSVLFYYDLAFNDYSPLWTRLNIIFITLSGPLISLIIGLLFLRIFVGSSKIGTNTRLFFIWIGIHGCNLFLGAFASGVSFDEGFGYVANWLYMNVFWKILFSLMFLFILSLIGYYSTSRFLETSNSIFRTRKENRFRFLLFQAVIPWLAGLLLIILVKIPNNMPYDTGNLITIFFAVIPVLFNRLAQPSMRPDKEHRRKTSVNWAFVAMFILLLAAYRIGLNSGLHFVVNIRFSIDITPI